MRLSVVIPTLNEEVDLPRTLKSLKFADEIIIIDTGSTDNTVAIAKKHHTSVYSLPMTTFSKIRNFGDSKATGDWILSLEADVVITKELAREISFRIQNSQVSAYQIGRQNVIWGKAIMYTDWGPKDDCHIWLYRKGSGRWISNVHEEYVTPRRVGKLTNHLVHYNYTSITEFIAKTNTYSQFAKVQYTPKLWFAPVYDFLKRYFYKLGVLDGYHGLFLSYLQAIYHLNVLVKSRP